MEKPNIVWYTLCYNEEDILPFIIDYWKEIATKVIVYDDNSTDKSREILSKYDWIEIRNFPYNSKNTLNDHINRVIKNNCWKECVGQNVDWVICSDLDEILYAKNLFDKLKICKNKDISIIFSQGYNFVSATFPKYDGTYMHEIIKKCIHDSVYDKPIIFNPNKVSEIDYAVGGHSLENPLYEGISLYASNIYLFHFKYLGIDYLLKKRKLIKNRLSELNKLMKWGSQYLLDEKQIIDEYENIFSNATINVEDLLK